MQVLECGGILKKLIITIKNNKAKMQNEIFVT